MIMLRGATCAVLVLSGTVCPSEGFGQAEPSACQAGDLGVLNGSFDCATTSSGSGWYYAAAPSDTSNGYQAEITTAPGRSTNVLKITPNVQNDQLALYLNRDMLWQENITLGVQTARQVVLRFDHLVTQRVAFEKSVIAFLSVTARSEDGSTDVGSATLPIAAHAFVPDSDESPPEWTTSEVYVELADIGSPSAELTCTIFFKTNRLVTLEEGADQRDCTDSEGLYAEVMLDNVELRVIENSCWVAPQSEGQPGECDSTGSCGGSENQVEVPFTTTALAPVAGPTVQDPRTYTRYCVVETTCCGTGFPSTELRISSLLDAVDYVPSRSRSLTCTSGLITDLDGDGRVAGSDLSILLSAWGQIADDRTCLIADIDGSGTVDGSDLAALLGNWNGCT